MLLFVAVRLVLLSLPIAFMILLIPFVPNDYLLAIIYVLVIGVSSVRYSKKDFVFLAFGFVALLLAETLFISTGVEVFERRTLLGIMPVWLPLLWAYVFVAVKRSALMFEKSFA